MLLSAIAPDQPIAPVWLVMPLAFVVLLMLITHMWLLRKDDMPASRKRIRIANGTLMMFATPLVAYALGVAVPAQGRTFAFAWVAVTGIVVVVLFLAIMDMLNTWRLSLTERRAITGDVLARLHRDPTDQHGTPPPENRPA